MKHLMILILLLTGQNLYSQSFHVFDIDTTDFPIMRAKFYAFDAEGKQITNISPSEVTITENGEEREVLSISCPEYKPVAISSVITTDISGSMSGLPIEMAKEGTRAWIKGLPEGKSECAITTFNDGNFMVQEFTNNKQKLLDKINQYNAGGGTNYNAAMIDPLFGGILVLDKAQYKKVLVVISDGYPNFEPNTQYIISEANKRGVTVFSVTLGYRCPDNLKQISDATGGLWFENITNVADAKQIYLSILSYSRNLDHCEIVWSSEYQCKIQDIAVSFEYNSLKSENKYRIPETGIFQLKCDPNYIFFDEPEVGAKEQKKITVTAINSDFNVTDIILSNNDFDIEPKSFALKQNESIELTVSYTAKEKGYSFCVVDFINNICKTKFIATANHSGSPPLKNTLKLTHPEGGEKFLVGSDTLITWKGIPKTEPVKLEFSNDNGQSWQTITNSATGLKYIWNNIPKPPSDECIIRVKQLNNSDSTFEPHGIEWERSYGGYEDDKANYVEQTRDGGYIVAGYTLSSDSDISKNMGHEDYWIIKLNPVGELDWEKSYGGSYNERAKSIQQTIDGGYIVAGSSSSTDGDVSEHNGWGDDYWILKLSLEGELEWEKSFGGRNTDEAYSVQQTSDGGYIIAGNTGSSDGDVSKNNGGYDFWIIKLNPIGMLEWEKSFGGSGNDHAHSIQQTNDGGYIVAGSTSSNDGDVSENKGGYDYWIIKLSSEGELKWEKNYGGSENDIAYSVQQTYDGGYMVAGNSMSQDGDVSENMGYEDYWIIKLSPVGELEWENSYGGRFYDRARFIQQSIDGGYIIAGYSYSNDGDVGGWSRDYWIIKLNPAGNLDWKKNYGGRKSDEAHSIQQTTDGGYIIAGSSESSDGDVSENKGGADYWIVKLYPDEAQVIQSDFSGLFSIVMPNITSQDVDMLAVVRGSFRDSLVAGHIINHEKDFPVRIDTMYITGTNPDDFFFFTDEFPIYIPAASAKDMYFRFQPTDGGYREADVVIITQADTIRHKIYGNVIEPELLVLEDFIDFGLVKLGDFKDTLQAVTIMNTGTEQIEITKTQHSLPNAVDFTTLAGGGNFVLDPGDTCKMDLRFTPSEIGQTSGTLEFHYDGPDSPAIIQLFGDGYGSPIISNIPVEESKLLCENQDTIQVVINNDGNDNLEITDVTISGLYASEFMLLEEFSFKRLYVGESDTMYVIFTPNSSGDKEAQLNFTNNSDNAPDFVINLNASKDETSFTVNKQDILFQVIYENYAASEEIEITNTGTVPLTWQDPQIIDKFTLRNISPNPTPEGEVSTAEIYFAGAGEGYHNAVFEISDVCGDISEITATAEVGDKSAASAELQISNISGKPGDEVIAELHLKNRQNINIAGINSISVDLEFNPTLIYPQDHNVQHIDGKTAKIKITDISINQDEEEAISKIKFKVGLGNAESCELSLTNPETQGGEGEISLHNGTFKLLGVCYEGGARLINPSGKAGITDIKPNPAANEITIAVSLIEKGQTSIAIYNIEGEKVSEIYAGEVSTFGTYEFTSDISNLSNGTYYVIFQTPTVKDSKSIMIAR